MMCATVNDRVLRFSTNKPVAPAPKWKKTVFFHTSHFTLQHTKTRFPFLQQYTICDAYMRSIALKINAKRQVYTQQLDFVYLSKFEQRFAQNNHWRKQQQTALTRRWRRSTLFARASYTFTRNKLAILYPLEQRVRMQISWKRFLVGYCKLTDCPQHTVLYSLIRSYTHIYIVSKRIENVYITFRCYVWMVVCVVAVVSLLLVHHLNWPIVYILLHKQTDRHIRTLSVHKRHESGLHTHKHTHQHIRTHALYKMCLIALYVWVNRMSFGINEGRWHFELRCFNYIGFPAVADTRFPFKIAVIIWLLVLREKKKIKKPQWSVKRRHFNCDFSMISI